MDSMLEWVPIFVYVAGWLAEFIRYWRGKDATPAWAGGLLAVGWGAHSFLLGAALLRQAWTLATLLSGAAWLALVVYFLMGRRWRVGALRFILPPLAVALLLAAIYAAQHQLLDAGTAARLPGLSRDLLAGHIVALLAGHLLFALACLSSVAYLLQERRIKSKLTALPRSRLPSLGTLELLIHRSISLGFLCLSAGILLGMAVAGENRVRISWWDGRLLIPLASWLVYAAFLLLHDYQGRRGRFGAVWSIVGFTLVAISLLFELASLQAAH